MQNHVSSFQKKWNLDKILCRPQQQDQTSTPWPVRQVNTSHPHTESDHTHAGCQSDRGEILNPTKKEMKRTEKGPCGHNSYSLWSEQWWFKCSVYAFWFDAHRSSWGIKGTVVGMIIFPFDCISSLWGHSFFFLFLFVLLTPEHTLTS